MSDNLSNINSELSSSITSANISLTSTTMSTAASLFSQATTTMAENFLENQNPGVALPAFIADPTPPQQSSALFSSASHPPFQTAIESRFSVVSKQTVVSPPFVPSHTIPPPPTTSSSVSARNFTVVRKYSPAPVVSTLPAFEAVPLTGNTTSPATYQGISSSPSAPNLSQVFPGPSMMSPSAASTMNLGSFGTSNVTWAPIYGNKGVDQDVPVTSHSFENDARSPVHDFYRPVEPHWFYELSGTSTNWQPFSLSDTISLEESFQSGGGMLVSTNGGRYDVDVMARIRRPVYWNSDIGQGKVLRCTWFRKGPHDTSPIPYTEDVAAKLEDAYRQCVETKTWKRHVEVSGDYPGLVVLLSATSMVHYRSSVNAALPTSVSIEDTQACDIVKRGAEDFDLKVGESCQIDHLLFLVHGIGPVCDLSFRSVEECVDDFREMGNDLLSRHFQQSVQNSRVGRVEVLPISWHKAVHSNQFGIDERLKPITLRSIPMLREFTNDTIVDVLLYTSPAYCQLIIDTVACELTRLYGLFLKRNPKFTGGVSVAGHSLGSVILFDLLMHQKSPEVPLSEHMTQCPVEHSKTEVDADDGSEQRKKPIFDMGASKPEDMAEDSVGPGVEVLQEKGVGKVLTASTIRAQLSQINANEALTSVNFEMGTAGTGQPSIAYPQLPFQPQAVFLLGSPIAMFLAVRGLTELSPQYRLPTCPHVFNIFHPFDPVAYRLETLIHPHLRDLRPVLVPHHMGRKRMHLELKDTLERVGMDIKHRIVDSLQFTWNKLYNLYTGSEQQDALNQDDKAADLLGRVTLDGEELSSKNDFAARLNAFRRIDYVLQEKPYESFTEYIFALQAHLSYWKSEDTLLLMLKEIYRTMGIQSDLKAGASKTDVEPFARNNCSAFAIQQGVKSSCTDFPVVSMMPSTAATVPLINSSSSSVPVMPPISSGSAVPMMPVSSSHTSPHTLATSPITYNGGTKVLAGRPVVDPSVVTQPLGMDPTIEPLHSGLPPPPPPISDAKMNYRIKPARR